MLGLAEPFGGGVAASLAGADLVLPVAPHRAVHGLEGPPPEGGELVGVGVELVERLRVDGFEGVEPCGGDVLGEPVDRVAAAGAQPAVTTLVVGAAVAGWQGQPASSGWAIRYWSGRACFQCCDQRWS